MKISFISFLLFFTVSGISAQNLFKGQVVSASGLEPLSFASVYLKGSAQGSGANEAGYFQFRFNAKPGDTVVVRMMGYTSAGFAVKDIDSSKSYLIKLEDAPQALGTVLITNFTPLELLQNAISGLDKNYFTETTGQSISLIQSAKVRGQYIRYLAAEADMFIPTYDNKHKKDTRIRIRNGKAYERENAKDGIYLFNLKGELDEIGLGNRLRWLESTFRYWDTVRIASKIILDGHNVYKLEFVKHVMVGNATKSSRAVLYIDELSKAVVSFYLAGDINVEKSDIVLNTPDSVVTAAAIYNEGAINYRPYQNKWIISDVQFKVDFLVNYYRSKKDRSGTPYKTGLQENFILISFTNALTENVSRPGSRDCMDIYKDLFTQLDKQKAIQRENFSAIPKNTLSEYKLRGEEGR
jgi:hypothetical protein